MANYGDDEGTSDSWSSRLFAWEKITAVSIDNNYRFIEDYTEDIETVLLLAYWSFLVMDSIH